MLIRTCQCKPTLALLHGARRRAYKLSANQLNNNNNNFHPLNTQMFTTYCLLAFRTSINKTSPLSFGLFSQ